MKYISYKKFFNFLESLKRKYEVYVPVKKDKQRFYKQYTTFEEDIVIGEVRPFEPLKSFFTRAREKVVEDFKDEIPRAADKPYCIVGVKACDLKGFKVQDYVFSAQEHTSRDYQDPFYTEMRRKNLIIAADCTFAIDTCFCSALDITPYPQENFDINLSPLKGGFVVEIASQKGQDVFDKHSSLFEEAKKELISRREAQRQRVIKEVGENVKEYDVPRQEAFEGIIEKNRKANIWADEAKTCVECAACNAVCPTCHCFLLYDQKDDTSMARLRIWDSCMIKNFAEVAGGANPRSKLWMRLRNRFEKKFDFFPKVANIYACTGCGRCISACPAKIDIRKVLRKLVDNV